jgi:hypothetical protein
VNLGYKETIFYEEFGLVINFKLKNYEIKPLYRF